MAVPLQAQHRCVFVGNIPYDATEEQLIQICEEVGPVISFRLVIDRETGKPKGYGFCEYKDEETALSARRNLQGYEINGRQLRVDFAENDKEKNTDKSQQGRGGPGIVPGADTQKQVGAPALQDPSLLLPLGDSFAMTAATIMSGALGSAQTAITSNQIGLQNPAQLGSDPLTRHLAKMSRSQLTAIMSEVKAMAIQDKEQARKLLLSIPNLSKALFQAQIMLGMVPPQMLQMPNILQISAQPAEPAMQDSQTLPGLPPLPQNRMHLSVSPYAQEIQVPASVPAPYTVAPQFPIPSQIQNLQVVQNQIFQQNQQLVQPGVTSIPSLRPQSVSIPTSSSINQPVQTRLPQHTGQVLQTTSVYNAQRVGQNASTQQHSTLMRPQLSANRFQSPSLASSATLENRDLKGRDVNLIRKSNAYLDQRNRAPKMVKLNDGKASSSHANLAAPVYAATSQPSIKKETLTPEEQNTQMQLPSDVDSALLQQVLNLTPEQVNSLPPDQQQQVIQLQQILRQAA